MTKESAIQHFGSVTALARALSITPSAVSQWDEIPWGRQFELQILTGGALQADRKIKEPA